MSARTTVGLVKFSNVNQFERAKLRTSQKLTKSAVPTIEFPLKDLPRQYAAVYGYSNLSPEWMLSRSHCKHMAFNMNLKLVLIEEQTHRSGQYIPLVSMNSFMIS